MHGRLESTFLKKTINKAGENSYEKGRHLFKIINKNDLWKERSIEDILVLPTTTLVSVESRLVLIETRLMPVSPCLFVCLFVVRFFFQERSWLS